MRPAGGGPGPAGGGGSPAAIPASTSVGANVREIAPGVLEIDTLLGGWDHVTAGYLICGDAPVLVETGSQSSVEVVTAALGSLGVGAHELAGLAVTHIHLDHAGGVGDLAAAFPSATVYVHPRGARHLQDPTRLVDSAARVYGPLLDSLYGRLAPTDAGRIHVLADGQEITVSQGRSLRAIDSPGHAKHHVALFDSSTGLLFAGDAVGVRLPEAGVLRPSAPPPDFDLDLAVDSLHRFVEARPHRIALAHYGVVDVDPAELAGEAEATVRRWAEVAERAWREGSDIAAALATAFGDDLAAVDPAQAEKMETLNGIHSNAAGLARWLETRAGRGADRAHGSGGVAGVQAPDGAAGTSAPAGGPPDQRLTDA